MTVRRRALLRGPGGIGGRGAWATLIAASLAAPAAAQTPSEIGPDSLMAHVSFLSRDILGGRGAGSEGYWHAASYAARVLAEADLRPLVGSGQTATLIQTFEAPATYVSPPVTSFNVVGLIEGTDPELRGQYVSIGAHLDGIGLRGGELNNAANDNATGSAAVIEMARALLRDPPRRSVIVGLWGAEEIGLHGSRHFVENAPIPMDSVVAHLNFDGIGRYDRAVPGVTEVYALGGAEICEALDDELERVNEATVGATLYRDDAEGWFQFSDHYNFHLAGVPSVFFTDLGSEDYHRPTDDAVAIDPARFASTTRLALALTRALADREEPICPPA